MGTSSTWITLLLLSLSTCCSALPRRNDFPKPVLPQPLAKAGSILLNNADQDAATRSIVEPTLPVVTPLFQSNSIMDSVKKVVNAINFVQKINKPGDNGIMEKIGELMASFKTVKQIRDKCSDDKTKKDVSCTSINVHGFYDFFGETWHKIETFYKKWSDPIKERITEIEENKEDYKTTEPGGTTIVTKPNTYFSTLIYFLDMFGLDGTPEATYVKEKEEKEEKEEVPTPQQIKDDALIAGEFQHIKRIEKHNYWTKSVNAAIKLAGLGVFGALCAQNCGIENFFGVGTPLPPLDSEDEAANQAAIQADIAGDTDGDNDVDADDGRRRDTVVDDSENDSYHGYYHFGKYVAYDIQQPQVQPEQNNHFRVVQESDVNINNNNNNNNHLLQPEQHPDFSSRVLPYQMPAPVYRGARMFGR